MTDDELRELVAGNAQRIKDLTENQNRTDLQLAKTDAQLAKTDAKLDRLAEMYGGVGNNQGKVAEEFYFNSLKKNPTIGEIRFDLIEKNVTRCVAQIEEEYDLLLVNGQDVFIIEVKYRVHPRDVDRLIGRKAAHFKTLYPEYAHCRRHLGLATFAIEDEVKQLALEQGVTILQRRGEVFETLVDCDRLR